MSSIVVAGDTSGTVTLQAPAVAGSTTLTLPSTSGTLAINGPAFSAYQSSAQIITNATDTTVVFNTKIFDVNTNYNTTNGVFTPNVAGYYQVNTYLALSGSGITLASGNIRKNGSIASYIATTAFAFNSTPVRMSGSTLIYCNGTTDNITISAYITASSGWNITEGSFSAVLVRGA